MNIQDSGGVSNRINITSVIIVVIIYSVLILLTVGFAILPLGLLCWAGYSIALKEIRAISHSATLFKKSYPLRYFGSSHGEFSHIYEYAGDLEISIAGSIEKCLIERTPVTGIRTVTITDIDKRLMRPEGRLFRVTNSVSTSRGTNVTLLMRFDSFGKMHEVKWWVLAGGYIDKNKMFNFIAYAPLTIWFWILPYLNREHDILPRIRTVYSSTYNSFDVEMHVKSLHEVVFSALIEELDRNGIDTSSLKLQKMQLMNINISGGKVNMGNIVQGAMNKIMTNAGAN